MRIFLFSVLLSVASLANAQSSKNEHDALALAIASQQTLNEYAVGAVEPEAMKYSQRLRMTRAALDAQRQQWTTITPLDSSGNYLACRSALEQASLVAGLSGSKAVSAVDDEVFRSGKARLKQLRTDCDGLISRGRKPG
jgi:hypothetical protein